MSSIDVHPLKESVIEALWVQWGSLGSLVNSERRAHSLVDPEALLLTSLTLRHHERRLWDVLASWAKHGSNLFSLQRVKNLRNMYPNLAKERLAEFAHRTRMEGNDFRWRSLAGVDAGPVARNQDLWEAYPRVWQPSALMLQMRLGIGVGLTADLLSFLISNGGDWVGARLIAQATAYSVYSIRRAADNMASAHFIESTQAKPVQYRAKIELWQNLTGYDGKLPGWRFWHQIYAFAAKVILASENGEWKGLSPYLLSSKLRDLIENHQDAFILNHLDFPDPRMYAGEAYLPAFSEALEKMAGWMKNHV